MNDHDFAIMEAARNEAVDAYFNARPQLQTEGMNVATYQKLFEAGFTRAWDKVAKLTTERDELRAELAECQGELAALHKREPLSDAQIAVIWEETPGFKDELIDNFARAIEAAHGIGGE